MQFIGVLAKLIQFVCSNTTSTAQEAQDADMDTSSSTSGSTRSDGDGEKESAYGSCDSDNSIHGYYRNRSLSDQTKFKKVLTSLSEEVEESGQLAQLTELCELLSFCSDSSLSSPMVDSFSPVLVQLARHDTNPDIMLLAIRAINLGKIYVYLYVKWASLSKPAASTLPS